MFILSHCEGCGLYFEEVNGFHILRYDLSGKHVFNALGINGIVFRFLVGFYSVLIGRFNIGAEGQSGLCHSLVSLLQM